MKAFTVRSLVREAAVLTVVLLFCAANRAAANVIYEDVSYWLTNGTTVINPAQGPTDAYVKIQETVYDDLQGKQLLQQLLGANSIHGSAIPGVAINLYAYSISNLLYDNGPTGVGAGITGFTIPDPVLALGQWGPNAANSWWHVAPGNAGPATYEWDIDGNMNGLDGDGTGILKSQTFDSFLVAVPDGTPHGFVNGAWIHTWTGGGADEQLGVPPASQVDLIYGTLSAPIPEPSATALVALGFLGLIGLTWRRRA